MRRLPADPRGAPVVGAAGVAVADDLDEVILVGGSTRIPAVRALMWRLDRPGRPATRGRQQGCRYRLCRRCAVRGPGDGERWRRPWRVRRGGRSMAGERY